MKVIAVVQRKGGVGKTTVAVNFSGELLRRGYSVTIVDADPQASASTWSQPRRLGFNVRAAVPVGWKSVSWIKGIYKSGTDYVVIDTPPELGDTFKLCVELSDLLLIPCGPSSLDINATNQTVARIREICRPGNAAMPDTLVIPTRVDTLTLEGKQLAPELADLGYSVTGVLSFDVSYVRAFAAGQAVSTYAPGSDADREMRAIVDNALDRLNMSS